MPALIAHPVGGRFAKRSKSPKRGEATHARELKSRALAAAAQMRNGTDDVDESVCAGCFMARGIDLVLVPCGHAPFCGTCLRKWGREVSAPSFAMTCPICRAHISFVSGHAGGAEVALDGKLEHLEFLLSDVPSPGDTPGERALEALRAAHASAIAHRRRAEERSRTAAAVQASAAEVAEADAALAAVCQLEAEGTAKAIVNTRAFALRVARALADGRVGEAWYVPHQLGTDVRDAMLEGASFGDADALRVRRLRRWLLACERLPGDGGERAHRRSVCPATTEARSERFGALLVAIRSHGVQLA